MATIAVLGTLDSKGHEHAFVADEIRALGHQVLLIDVGSGGDPLITPDITREEVAAAAGIDLAPLLARADRGECVTAMAQAAPLLLQKLVQDGRIDGIISLGGGGGTAIASGAMRPLPLGFPKIIVSTLASGNTAHYLGESDINLMPSIVDVAGLNRVSKGVFRRAAASICAMVQSTNNPTEEKELIVVSMFGNTTECVDHARGLLEDAGYEVLVFHATGAGGRTMEKLILSGQVTAVLDLTTTEWADEIVGATLTAGPERMNAAADMNLPTVLAPGCVDMANFGEPTTVPEKFADRTFYHHNPQVTLMRTNAEENVQLGKVLAEKLNRHSSRAVMMLPLKGISIISVEGQPFHDAAADTALFDTIRQEAKHPVIEMETTINDPAFSTKAVEQLLSLIQS
ncbi:MAG: Tm-1-like ATP-binding domain-containing protein [Roseibacillus sp.]